MAFLLNATTADLLLLDIHQCFGKSLLSGCWPKQIHNWGVGKQVLQSWCHYQHYHHRCYCWLIFSLMSYCFSKTQRSRQVFHCATCQSPFAKGDRLSRSAGGNSDRLGKRHKLLVGGQPTISCTPVQTVREGKDCASWTQQLLLKKIAGIEPHNLRSKATCLTTMPFPSLKSFFS